MMWDKEVAVIYIKADMNTQICLKKSNEKMYNIRIKDVAEVFCRDKKIKQQTEQIHVMNIERNSKKKYAISIITMIEKIENYFSFPVIVQNLGELDFLVSIKAPKEKNWKIWTKVGVVAAITLFGSMFAIMAYNEDVDVSGVFDKIYKTMYGKVRKSPGIMEAAYAVGVGLGVILFFNHFGKKKLSNDPTPMEVEMEKYENDIDYTCIKEISRRQNER